jgi:hypothetical protein
MQVVVRIIVNTQPIVITFSTKVMKKLRVILNQFPQRNTPELIDKPAV